MKFIEAGTFSSDRAWGALDLVCMDNASVRLHWTDEAYHWHVNDGPEVFVVLDGNVRMHYRADGVQSYEDLGVGKI